MGALLSGRHGHPFAQASLDKALLIWLAVAGDRMADLVKFAELLMPMWILARGSRARPSILWATDAALGQSAEDPSQNARVLANQGFRMRQDEPL